ncbi:MAG: hypothetical protein UV57_C0044G0008 [Parcubacteria group bacterium GW2011_GWD2_43_10]|uniref:YdbS-like PH domain-containing protein n=5 Tax=Candidatus Vebleniibacteriota TaxID=1817921 RepID=A0A1G2Q944_9BACT|nr:MAG: hypothetical protein UV47_C0043G0006 [Parcubacteria group bacterium GW2011_GWA2_42_80]KKS78855.1 MAG: hypothetical protein UV52_C0024G0011 [Parcubacteria group bacterium GW2011_GWD1_42_9]KKS81507.1 MAG: hypothetical protein UV57_C0044G0008 [Parcubacteria group bacterium GW2011_GWD2_43_10]KKS93295.1 MAG: hypothetical protein UV69_C0009G0012 [Parcubacteria group bacterium GW2011_GWE2_43_12]KKT12027.1 MAG: hypothetical protein UV92_C0034G0008 [Parcubacteria group bacterium GW2011_GWA1_43_2
MLFTNKLLPSTLPNEKVILELRRHWFSFFRQAFIYLILLVGPLLAYYFIDKFEFSLWSHIYNGGLAEVITRLAISLYYLGVWVFFFHTWLDYYLDVWIITNERVLSLEQRGVFSRRVSELRLGRIQDVASEVKGMWETFLHFGNVNIQTAGEQPNFLFHQVPNPYEVAERLMRLVDEWNKLNPTPKDS